MSAPTIYYYSGNHICHELRPQGDGAWKSNDNFSARKGYKQIILSNPSNNDIRGGIPTELESYSDVFVRQDTNEVILFDKGTGKDSAGQDIEYYKNLLCTAGQSAGASDHEEHNSVTDNGEQGMRILVDLGKVIAPERTILTELNSGTTHDFARYMIIPSRESRYEIGFMMDGKKYRAPLSGGEPDDHIIILVQFRDGKPVKLKLQNEEWPAEDNVLPILPPKTPAQKADDILNGERLAPLVKKLEAFGEKGRRTVSGLKDTIAEVISSSRQPDIGKIEAKLIEWIGMFEKAYGPAITTETILNNKEVASLVAQLSAMGNEGKGKVESLRRAIDMTIAESRKPSIEKIKATLEESIKALTPVAAPAPAPAPAAPAVPAPAPAATAVPTAPAAEEPYPTVNTGAPAAPPPPAAPAAPPAVPKKKSPYENFILSYHQFTMVIDGYHNNARSEGNQLDTITSAYGKLYPYLDKGSKTYINDDNEYRMAKNYLATATLEFTFVLMLEGKPTGMTPQKLSENLAGALNGLKAAPDGTYKEPIDRLEGLALQLDGFIDKLDAAKKRLEEEKKIALENGIKLSHYKKFSDILRDANNPTFPAGVRVMDEFDFLTGKGENDHNPIYYMVVAKDTDLNAAFKPLAATFPLSQWIYCFANADDTISIDHYHAETLEISALGDPAAENGDRYIFWVTREAADRIEKAPGVQDVTTQKEIPLKEALKTRITQEFEKISKGLEEIEKLMPADDKK